MNLEILGTVAHRAESEEIMSRQKKVNTEVVANNTTETKEVVVMNAMDKRANRVVINANENGGWTAEFFKTHFSIGTIDSEKTEWVADKNKTMTGQREDFRQWAIDHCAMAGATWVPDDLREDWNVRVAKYETDELVQRDIDKMIADLVLPNIDYAKHGLSYMRAEFEEIIPITKTSKGADIKYVSDGKYDKNGNWAWCTIPTTLVFDHEGTEIYVTRNFEIISGCLKKMRITKPEFEIEVKSQIAVAEVVNA